MLVNEINLLLKFERNREILMQYKVDSFSKEEITLMEKDFEYIMELAKVENKLCWHLDVTFRQDINKILDKNALSNLEIINKFCEY